MESFLAEPDQEIIQQYSEGSAIYLISKGECVVIVSEESTGNKGSLGSAKKKKKNGSSSDDKLLRSGQLFGEISIIYDCLTTATVRAKKYCNLAKLSKEKYKEITTTYPRINEEIKNGIQQYDDKMLKFIKRSLK